MHRQISGNYYRSVDTSTYHLQSILLAYIYMYHQLKIWTTTQIKFQTPNRSHRNYLVIKSRRNFRRNLNPFFTC